MSSNKRLTGQGEDHFLERGQCSHVNQMPDADHYYYTFFFAGSQVAEGEPLSVPPLSVPLEGQHPSALGY